MNHPWVFNFQSYHRVPINEITSNHELNLCKYELQDGEWAVAQNLCDTLKVGILSHN